MKTHITQSVAALAFVAMFDVQLCSADWIAGRDLAVNERPNGPQELVNPNPTVPEWSYGYRTTVSGTSLTLFSPPLDHFNDAGGHPAYDGWTRADGFGPTVAVNAGSSPIVFNFGSGNLEPLDPQEIALHPRSDGTLSVVRWTALAAGTYTIDAYWDDIDTHGGGGASGHIVVNGVSIHDAFWGNGGGSVTTKIQALNAGDTIDFLLGANGNNLFDSTAFDATIVPEPSSFVLMATFTIGLLARIGRRWLLSQADWVPHWPNVNSRSCT